MTTTSQSTPPITIMTNSKEEAQTVDLESTNNSSYVDNYHQKCYYPKIVLARIRRRYAKMHHILEVADRKSVSRSLGSSLETVVPTYFVNDVTVGGNWNYVDSNDNSEYYRLRRTFSNEQFNKKTRTGFQVTYFENKLSDERRICDVAWGSGSSFSGLFGSMEDCSSIWSKDDYQCAAESDVDDLDMYAHTKRLRRSSSLRRTYNKLERVHKKSVRFADALGLELQSVRMHDTSYNIPLIIPQSALDDLRSGLEEMHKSEGTQYICVCFAQPGLDVDFLERVLRDRVALESCTVGGPRDLTATGTVCVANICHRKEVTVRYTINSWVTCDDIISSYVQNPVSEAIDRFSFSIALPVGLSVGSRLMFAVRFAAVDLHQVFWDNNFGKDYPLECYAKAVPIRESDSAWMHFL